jgi:hypothetical protein
MKKLLTIFLFIIIAVQILPIVELSKFIEDKEYVEDDFCEDVEKEKKFEKDVAFFVNFSTINVKKKKSQNHFPIAATCLHPHPICDITTPPPNLG